MGARALLRPALIFIVALAVVGCRSGANAEGQWTRIDPKTLSPMGDVLTIEGETWQMTGFPAMSGTVKIEDGVIQLLVERVGDQSREEAISTPGATGVAESLDRVDEQLKFKVIKEGGKTFLEQITKSKSLAELRFEKRSK